MIGVDDDDGDHQAHQEGANHAVEQTWLPAVELNHLDPHDSVTHAVTQHAYQKHLFDRKNSQNSVRITPEEGSRDQI